MYVNVFLQLLSFIIILKLDPKKKEGKTESNTFIQQTNSFSNSGDRTTLLLRFQKKKKYFFVAKELLLVTKNTPVRPIILICAQDLL